MMVPGASVWHQECRHEPVYAHANARAIKKNVVPNVMNHRQRCVRHETVWYSNVTKHNSANHGERPERGRRGVKVGVG